VGLVLGLSTVGSKRRKGDELPRNGLWCLREILVSVAESTHRCCQDLSLQGQGFLSIQPEQKIRYAVGLHLTALV